MDECFQDGKAFRFGNEIYYLTNMYIDTEPRYNIELPLLCRTGIPLDIEEYV